MVMVDKLLIIRELLNLVAEFRASARPNEFGVRFRGIGSIESPALTARLIGPTYTVCIFVSFLYREWTVSVADEKGIIYSVGISNVHFINPSTLYDLTRPSHWKGR